MSLVTCPNCKEKVDVDSDECPVCGYKLFDFEIDTHEDTFHDHYSDYVGTTKSAKPIYKFLTFISVFAFLGGMFWGIYEVILSANPSEDASTEAYFLVYFGIGLFIITTILSSIDRNASSKE